MIRDVEQFSAPDRKSRAVFYISVILCKTLYLPILSLAFPAGDLHVPGGCAAWNRGADYVSTAIRLV